MVTDIDGVVNILWDKRITEKMMSVPSAILTNAWLAYSNYSKTRLDWGAKMKLEVGAEKKEEVITGMTVRGMVQTSSAVVVD